MDFAGRYWIGIKMLLIFTKNKALWVNLDNKIPFFENMYDRNKLWPKKSLDKLDSVLLNF